MSINMAWPRGWAKRIFFALLVAFASAAQKEEGSDDDPGLNTYVTVCPPRIRARVGC